MTKVIIFLLATVVCSFAQRAIPADNVDRPVLIVTSNGGGGSGFFLEDGKHVFLATAKHVLFDTHTTANGMTNVLKAPKIQCFSWHTTETNQTDTIIEFDLVALQNSGEIRYHTNRDVAVIRVAEFKKTNDPTVFLIRKAFASYKKEGQIHSSNTNDCRSFSEILVGNDIFLFGYPASITAHPSSHVDPRRPLLRKGIIADKNPGTKQVILDCPVYQGNSGGPVIQVEMNGLGSSFRIIGIVVSFVPSIETWRNLGLNYQNETVFNSGYSLVEPVDFIFELLW